MDTGFLQGKSDNLPKIDSLTLFSFLGNNPDFVGAEMRNINTASSARENYGDHAVGYVQIKRESELCIVKAKITPEHRVRQKAYNVEVTCNEKEGKILTVNCEDCVASLGGCKHAIAFLMWLHRRSEEPAPTSVTSYWKKSKLSAVGTSLKFIRGRDLGRQPRAIVETNGQSFLQAVVDCSQELNQTEFVLGKYYKQFTPVEKLSLHYICESYFENLRIIEVPTADHFMRFCKTNMSVVSTKLAEKSTREQAKCPLWHELRYCRITASKAYEAQHCKTLDGTLVESLFGARKLKDSAAMKRGRELEGEVIKIVQTKIKEKIRKWGLVLCAEYPVLGASPDGISEKFAVEIKCPASEQAVKQYLTKNGKITAKYTTQVQLQMHFCKKEHAIFCVADSNFEVSKNVNIVYLDYDESFCLEVLEKCTLFWKEAIFPKIKNNYQ